MENSPMRALVGCHGLSTMPGRMVRSGIQEFVFQTLRALYNFHSPHFDLIPMLYQPRLGANNVSDPRLLHPMDSVVLQAACQELGLTCGDILKRWPILEGIITPSGQLHSAAEEKSWQLLRNADVYFETSLCDIRHIQLLLEKEPQKPLVGMALHDLSPLLFPHYTESANLGWFRKMYMQSLKQCDFTIADSRHSAIDGLRFLPKNLRLHYCKLPTPWRKPTFESAPREPFFLSIATLEPRKNLANVVRGFARFCQLFGPFKLVLVGGKGWNTEPYFSQLEPAVRAAISYPGYVSEEELQHLISRATGLILASHYEGFGIPLAQAAVYNTPVITCAHSSLPEAIASTAFLVPPHEPDEIACAMAALANRSLSLKVPPEGHSAQNMLAGWCSIFKDIMQPDVASANEIFPINKNPAIGIDVQFLNKGTAAEAFVKYGPALVAHKAVLRWFCRLFPSIDTHDADALLPTDADWESYGILDHFSMRSLRCTQSDLSFLVKQCDALLLPSPSDMASITEWERFAGHGLKLFAVLEGDTNAIPNGYLEFLKKHAQRVYVEKKWAKTLAKTLEAGSAAVVVYQGNLASRQTIAFILGDIVEFLEDKK